MTGSLFRGRLCQPRERAAVAIRVSEPGEQGLPFRRTPIEGCRDDATSGAGRHRKPDSKWSPPKLVRYGIAALGIDRDNSNVVIFGVRLPRDECEPPMERACGFLPA